MIGDVLVQAGVLSGVVFGAVRLGLNGTRKRQDNLEAGMRVVLDQMCETREEVARICGKLDATHDLIERIATLQARR